MKFVRAVWKFLVGVKDMLVLLFMLQAWVSRRVSGQVRDA